MGFHEDNSGTEPPKRERKQARVRAGTAHAALVFDGNNCLGWCQFGVPDEVPRIKNRAEYEKGLTELPDWRIACNFVGKGHRRKGVATAALAGALDLIADLGGGKVEGYPEDAGSVPAGFLYHGALSTFENLGFVRDRKIGKHRWVVAKVVRSRVASSASPLSQRPRIGSWPSSSRPTSRPRSGSSLPEFVLEPLGPEHNEQDYDAWTSSMEHIAETPGYPDGSWPREMTRDENRADLQPHRRLPQPEGVHVHGARSWRP